MGNGDTASHILNFRTDTCKWLVSYLGYFSLGENVSVTHWRGGWMDCSQSVYFG